MLVKKMLEDPEEFNPTLKPQIFTRRENDEPLGSEEFYKRQMQWYLVS
jgi:hypothetical protein